jgi:hypothetical protein
MTRGMKRRALGIAVLLPLAGLAAGIGVQQSRLSAASVWRIPVTLTDWARLPRGARLGFRYGWALAGDPALCRPGRCTLCLTATAEGPVAEIVGPGARCAARVDAGKSCIAVDGHLPCFSAHLQVSEASADAVEQLYRTRRSAPIVARLDADGRLVPERLVTAE